MNKKNNKKKNREKYKSLKIKEYQYYRKILSNDRNHQTPKYKYLLYNININININTRAIMILENTSQIKKIMRNNLNLQVII